MNKIESAARSVDSRFLNGLLNSRFADVARDLLPESAKRKLRQIVHGEKGRYPLQEPVIVCLAGQEARFWIRNHSDWYRITTENFEGDYGHILIKTLTDMDRPDFVDVGSAQGYYSILAAKAGSRVVSIDPDPISQNSLQENLLLNPELEDNVKVMGIALGEKPGKMRLYIDKSGTYAPSLRKTVRGLKDVMEVQVTTMDVLVFDGIIPSPDVVKIDVEGAEGLVVSGMQGILSSAEKPKNIFIELHRTYLPRFGTTETEVADNITKNGYTLQNRWERRNEMLCHFTSK